MKRILIVTLLLGLILITGCTSEKTSGVPSGDNCAENVAYIQQGVDKFKTEVGTYPGDVQELLTTVNGKGPFVEVIPECPAGNVYVIVDGIVKETQKQ